MNIITKAQKERILKLYQNQDYTVIEIANLVGLSESGVRQVCANAYKLGIIEPRRKDFALKQMTPKFSPEDEQKIAVDYYENDLSLSQLKQKWNIHPMQLQRIRNKFADQFPPKKRGRKWYKEKAEQN